MRERETERFSNGELGNGNGEAMDFSICLWRFIAPNSKSSGNHFLPIREEDRLIRGFCINQNQIISSSIFSLYIYFAFADMDKTTSN